MKLLFGAKQAKDSELSRHDMPSSLLSHTFVLEASAVISQPERDPRRSQKRQLRLHECRRRLFLKFWCTFDNIDPKGPHVENSRAV